MNAPTTLRPPVTTPSAWHVRQVFLVTSLGIVLAALDLTVTNLAFPAIGKTFPHSASALSWILNGYTIAYGSLLVTAGRLADRLGRRRVFFAGLSTFAAGSMLSGLAPSLEILVAGRAVQGVGASAMIPASLGLLLVAAPPERRAVWVALWGAATAVAAALGPTLGGVIIQEAGWRWAFLLNLPVVAVALIWGRSVLTESSDGGSRAPDPVGVALLSAGLGFVALALVEAPNWGWTDPRTVAAASAAVFAVLAFIYRSWRVANPVVELHLLRERGFATANIGQTLMAGAVFTMLLCQVLFLTSIWHYGLIQAGFAVSPAALTSSVVSWRSGRLAQRYGFRPVLTVGTLLFAAGALLLSFSLDASPAWWTRWLPGAVLIGVGIGATLPIFSAAAVSALPPAQFSVGSAVNQTAKQLGAILGISILVALIGAHPDVARFRDAYIMFSAWAVTAAAVVAVGLRAPTRARALQTELLPEVAEREAA